jgi:hypothetical protein
MDCDMKRQGIALSTPSMGLSRALVRSPRR